MSANPLTDQLLAAFNETERDNPPPPWTRELLEDFARTLTRVIPELDPTIIGQVLMHTGAVFHSMATDDDCPFRDSAIFGANILIGAGGRLFTGGSETSAT